jgi:prefoldin subunit 5
MKQTCAAMRPGTGVSQQARQDQLQGISSQLQGIGSQLQGISSQLQGISSQLQGIDPPKAMVLLA